MKKLLHLNAHHPYSFSEGSLNAALTEHAIAFATEKGYDVRQTSSAENYNVEEELEEHQWVDLIMLQAPVNWMGVPWSFKKYMDEVYSAGQAFQHARFFRCIRALYSNYQHRDLTLG